LTLAGRTVMQLVREIANEAQVGGVPVSVG
jgi:hypothetical protein